MPGELLVTTLSGDTSKFSVIAHLRPGSLPYEYLKDPGAWKPFWCASNHHQNHHQNLSHHSPVIVKVTPQVQDDAIKTPTQSGSSRNYMAVCEYVDQGIWMFCRMHKSVRVRDIKALPQHQEQQQPPPTHPIPRYPLSADADLYDAFVSWTLEPNWQITQSRYNLNMNPNAADNDTNPSNMSSSCGMATSQDPFAIPNSTAHQETPGDLFKAKYIETLYSKTPLSYFAKSALSRIRALCREHASDKQTYLVAFFKLLQSLVVDIGTIDTKFVTSTTTTTTTTTISEAESTLLNRLLSSAASPEAKKAVLDALKLREIQLQAILLLELIAITESDPSVALMASEPDSEGPHSSTATPTQKKPNQKKLVKTARPMLIRSRNSKQTGRPGTPGVSSPPPPNKLPFKVHVELLFDRLCIMQALEETTQTLIASSETVPPSQNKQKSPPKQDKILEFCIEVILPYYGNRLPDLTKALVRKIKGMVTKWSIVPAGRSTSSRNTTLETKEKSPDGYYGADNITRIADAKSSDNKSSDTKPLSLSPAVPAFRTKSKTLLNNQKRQVEVISLKAIRKDSLDSELANAIKNVSRPNRSAALDSLGGTGSMGHPRKRAAGLSFTKQPVKPKVIQVNATPVKKKRGLSLKPYNVEESPSTPSKRSRHDFVVSSPVQDTDEDTD